MRQGRSWLVLLYALATLLAQGGHDHGHGPDSHSRPTVANIACDDAALHVEAHPTQGTAHPFDQCPACQFRAQNLAWFAREPADEPVAVELATELPRQTILAPSVLRANSRAPPTA